MKHLQYPLLFSLLIISFKAYSQSDRVYYDKNWQKADFTSAEYYRTVHKQPDGLYKVEDHFMTNDKIQMSGFYQNPDSESKEGNFVYYDDKGNKTNEGAYKENKKVGLWTAYYPNSTKVWAVTHFKDGKETGEQISYYEDGKVKRREMHYENSDVVDGKCYDESGNEIKFTPLEILPKADYDYTNFLASNIKYPNSARENDIQGKVIVKFVINEDGIISDIAVIKSVDPALDAEALRVVSKFPKWQPGKFDDKIVKTFFTLPIVFNLK